VRYKIKENKDQLAFSFRRQSWKTNSAVLLFCLVIFVLISNAVFKVYRSAEESKEGVVSKQVKLATLEEREKFLNEELKKIDGPGGREHALREKFGVGMPGENLAIIVESDMSNSATSSSIWLTIKGFFGNLFK
jgi:cell division protein FtsB